MHDDALACFEKAVRSVQADQLFAHVDVQEQVSRDLDAYRRIVVVGTGKASMAMAGAFEQQVPGRVDAGIVTVAHGYMDSLPASQRAPHFIQVTAAGHPVPDQDGVRAATHVLELADGCGQDDLYVVLVSGGGSSLWPAFADGVSLDAAQTTFSLLLESGADIHQMNAVRKHLSRIGGGRLAARAHPADVTAFILSDVVGDDVSVVASGPTAPDRSTFADAMEVLHHFDLWEGTPEPVRRVLERGAAGDVAETLRADDALLDRVNNVLIGRNRTALEAAASEARTRGYEAHVVDDRVTGEARDVGERSIRSALERDVTKPTCLVWGGETTVTIRGDGHGGRNQEMVLSAARVLHESERDVLFMSGGTDGIDGPTDAAGAWCTQETVRRGAEHGLDARAHLENNDAYPFFEALGALVKTGPTHTNVMDLQLAFIRP